MRSWELITAIVSFLPLLLQLLPTANGATKHGQIVHFHPISSAQYESIMELTLGKPVISEGRLIASGLAGLTGLTAGLTTGWATSFIPTIITNLLHGGDNNKTMQKESYPLCVIRADNALDQAKGRSADVRSDHNVDGGDDNWHNHVDNHHHGNHEHEHDHHYPNNDNYSNDDHHHNNGGRKKRPAIVNCIMVVKDDDKDDDDDVDENYHKPWRPHSHSPPYPHSHYLHPYPHPDPYQGEPGQEFSGGYPWSEYPGGGHPGKYPGGGFGWGNPWYWYYLYMAGHPFYGMTSGMTDGMTNGMSTAMADSIPTANVQGDEMQMTDAIQDHHSSSVQQDVPSSQYIQAIKNNRHKSRTNLHSHSHASSSSHSHPVHVRTRPSQQKKYQKSHTKSKRDEVTSSASTYPPYSQASSSYSGNGYQLSAYPQYNYQSNYPKVSYTHALTYPAPVYVRTYTRQEQKPTANTKRQQHQQPQHQQPQHQQQLANDLDSEEMENSAEYIKVRSN